MKKFLLTKKGMSLVEMLIGIAIIAGTGSIIVKSGLFVQNSKKVLEQKGELREMEDGLLSALKSLVFYTKSIDGTLRNEGLCRSLLILVQFHPSLQSMGI